MGQAFREPIDDGACRRDPSEGARCAPTAIHMTEASARSGATPVASLDDLSIIERIRQGDETAFAHLVDQHDASLRRVARFHVSDRAIADEVVQDTWLGVIRGIWAFEGRASLKTWIFRILINRAKTRAGREGRTVPFTRVPNGVDVAEAAVAASRSQPAGDPAEPGHWTHPPRELAASPEHCLLAREVREQLQIAIAALPEHQRLVLILRDIEGHSTGEVCDLLGVQEANVRVRLHRARVKVRLALEPYLGRV